jgi:hypothetical protein
MRWFKADPAGGSPALPSATAPAPNAGLDEVGIDDIRDRMLAFVQAADSERFPHVAHRIRYAKDIEGLWFLRGDLMALLASSHGEAAARRSLAVLGAMFDGLLPEGLRARPCPLNSRGRH